MRDQGRLEVSIRSDPFAIRVARSWVRGVAEEAGLDDAEARDLAVALSEVCSNAHRHSYGGRTDGRIDLRADVTEGRVEITVRDYGVAFDESAYREPELSEPTEGGYGVFLIRSLTDEVQFTDTGAGTQVVLVKMRRRSQENR